MTRWIMVLVLASFVQIFTGHGQESSAFPLVVSNNILLVEATLNQNTTGLYILDTGADEMILNERYHEFLRGDEQLFTSVNETVLSYKANSKIELDFIGHKEDIGRFYLMDLSSLESFLKLEIHGIIGMNTLKDMTIHMDFNQETITRLTKDEALPSWDRMLMDQNSIVPVVEASSNGNSFRFMIDSGASSHIIDKTYLRAKHKDLTELRPVQLMNHTGEVVETRRLIVNDWNLLPETEAIFLESDLTHINTSENDPIQGVLSLHLLNQEQIILDFNRHQFLFNSSKTASLN